MAFNPVLSVKDKKKFVMDFASGMIFTSQMLPKESLQQIIGSVFMPVALGGLDGLDEDDLKNLVFVWEYTSEAAPRNINGYPMFFSCKLMHIDDWADIYPEIRKEMDRRETFLNDEEEERDG